MHRFLKRNDSNNCSPSTSDSSSNEDSDVELGLGLAGMCRSGNADSAVTNSRKGKAGRKGKRKLGSSAKCAIKCIPLESNPELLTEQSRNLGATVGEWVDIYSLDEQSLSAIPKPVIAVVLLLPISKEYLEICRMDKEEKNPEVNSNVFFLKQYVENGCGIIGLIHSLANNAEDVKLKEGSPLSNFIKSTTGMTAEGRGKELAKCNGVRNVHSHADNFEPDPNEGEGGAPNHFVAFVRKDDTLYELDGMRMRPINHGATSASNLLGDVASICMQKIAQNPTHHSFTLMALTTGLS